MRAPALALALVAAGPAMAQECAREDAALARIERELPDPGALPTDKQITCISLEVNLDFVQRLEVLAQACPGAPLAARLDAHRARAAGFGATFAQRRCKRAMVR